MAKPKPSRIREQAHRFLLGAAVLAGHAWRGVARYGTAVGGVVLLSVGAAQVYGPAGLIVAGALLLGDRVVDDYRTDRDQRQAQQRGGEQQ